MADRYHHVNVAWPEACPKPTAQEAISGARRLITFAYRFAASEGVLIKGTKPPIRKFVATSGRRYTYPRRGVMYVNPEGHHFGGWKDIVHDLSHWAARRFWGDAHSARHAYLERLMTEHVVTSGWIDGKLKRPDKTKVPAQVQRQQRVMQRLAAWEAKRKRAEGAIRKLQRQARYYDRVMAPQ